jgi:hypothetical protein
MITVGGSEVSGPDAEVVRVRVSIGFVLGSSWRFTVGWSTGELPKFD